MGTARIRSPWFGFAFGCVLVVFAFADLAAGHGTALPLFLSSAPVSLFPVVGFVTTPLWWAAIGWTVRLRWRWALALLVTSHLAAIAWVLENGLRGEKALIDEYFWRTAQMMPGWVWTGLVVHAVGVIATFVLLCVPRVWSVQPRAVGVAATVAFSLAVGTASVFSQGSAPPTRQALVDDLVTANRILANEGVVDGYGHVSVRNPANANRYFLARAGAPALVTAADIVEYDLDSNPASGSGAGYQERFIHGEIYKARPDVTAVVHCHCLDVIPFAATNVPLRPMYHMGYFIGEGVPVFDIRATAGLTDMLVSTPSLGQALARVLGRRSAALMRGHGAVVVADSLHVVVAKAYYLNVNARLQQQAIQLRSGVTYLDPEEAKKAVQTYERSWEFWKSRLR